MAIFVCENQWEPGMSESFPNSIVVDSRGVAVANLPNAVVIPLKRKYRNA